MRVLVVQNDYGRFSGEEEAVETMARVLGAQGHDVSWYRRSSAELSGSLAKEAKAFLTGIYNPMSRRQVRRLLASERIDLVQLQNLYPLISPSVLLACRDAGTPVVMRCPNYRLFCPNGLHLNRGQICERCLGPGREWHCIVNNCEDRLAKSIGYAARGAFARLSGIVLDHVDGFLVLSEFQKRRFADLGIPDEKLTVLPNIAPKVGAGGSAGSGDYVAYVGRVSREKGIDVLLDAARRLPEVPFEIAGAVADGLRVKADAPNNVTFRGFLGGPQLQEFFAGSRMIVCPSIWWEGFPNVVARAMAHGKPVVASDLGVLSEIVLHERTGLLFTAGSATALAYAIESLWQDADRCAAMGAAGRARALAEYSEERLYTRLMDAYSRAKALRKRVNASCSHES